MHTIKIPTKYPRPKFSIGDAVIYDISSDCPKIGEISGLSWFPQENQWSYQIQDLISTDSDCEVFPCEDDLMLVSELLKIWQSSSRSKLPHKIAS